MTRARYHELSRNLELKLTQEEIDEGWFFCCEWDDMLIRKGDPESSCCTCLPEEERGSVPQERDVDEAYWEFDRRFRDEMLDLARWALGRARSWLGIRSDLD